MLRYLYSKRSAAVQQRKQVFQQLAVRESTVYKRLKIQHHSVFYAFKLFFGGKLYKFNAGIFFSCSRKHIIGIIRTCYFCVRKFFVNTAVLFRMPHPITSAECTFELVIELAGSIAGIVRSGLNLLYCAALQSNIPVPHYLLFFIWRLYHKNDGEAIFSENFFHLSQESSNISKFLTKMRENSIILCGIKKEQFYCRYNMKGINIYENR